MSDYAKLEKLRERERELEDKEFDKDYMPHTPKVKGGSAVLDMYKRRNYPVVKRNDLIQNTRYRLTLNEQKFILHMVQLITNKTKELNPVTISFRQYAEFLGLKPYRFTVHKMKKALQKLNSKQFWMNHYVNGHRKEDLYMWFTKVSIDHDDNTVTVQFNPQLKPYLIETKQFFTQYNYFYIMTMRSTYSIQLYEYFISFLSLQNNRLGFNFTLDQIRRHLDIQDKPAYKSYSNMRTRILEPAKKEINLLTDVKVRYKPYKKGRKVIGINVLIRKKDKNQLADAQNIVEKRLMQHDNKI